MQRAAAKPGPQPDGRAFAIDRVEALGWSLIALHAALLVATGAVPAWGWALVAVLAGVTAPSLAGIWVAPWAVRAGLLAGASIAVQATGNEAATAAWMWLMLAVAGPALRGRPPVAALGTALLTATAATTLAATGADWSLVAPATAAVLFVGALATVLADSLRDVQGAVAALHSREKDAALQERLRISRELHDSVSQALFAMTLQARAAQIQLDRAGLAAEAPVRRTVGDVADLARGALAEIRALIFELRPRALVEEGFVSAVRTHAAAVGSRHGVEVTVEAPPERIFVGDWVEEHLLRVIQEAVGNAARHADASSIDVDIVTTGSPPWVSVTVRDDGRGFDPDGRFDGHFGLQTMGERVAVLGGQLRVESGPGRGTVVSVAVPMAGGRQASESPSGSALA